jgi:uncharacterized RDD family membrane protein YckC
MEPNDRPDRAPAAPAEPQAPAEPAPPPYEPQPPAAVYVPPWAVGPQPGMPPPPSAPFQPGVPPQPGLHAPPGTPSWALPAPPVEAGPAPGILYAGFGVRLVAYVIDWVILGIVSGVIWFGALAVGISAVGVDRFSTISTVGGSITPDEAAAALTFAEYLYAGLGIAWLVTALYFILMWHTGGTVGMRALGLRVAREEDGRPIGYGRATARYLGYLVDWLALGIGLLWVGVDSRKQGWHDKIAGTFVVKRA